MPLPRPDQVFAALAQPRLVELATIVQIRGAEAMSHEQLVGILSTVRNLEYRDLLLRLSLPELRRVCARVGVRKVTGDAAEIVDFLVSGKPLPSPLAWAVAAELARNTPPPPPRPGRPPARGELGFEATLWHAADRLRSNMDAAEYKHVVLGLLFLKFIAGAGPPLRLVEPGVAPAARGFVVPPEARWQTLLAGAGAPAIARDLDQAMAALEAHNPVLRGVLPQIYQRPGLDPARLRELLALLDTVDQVGPGVRGAHDILGRVYEYFLSAFASAEGKNGGQYYTPPSVVALLVAMLAPAHGSVYDPACGSGGMFVQSKQWFQEHGGARTDLQFFGQESNATTWRLAKMNLAVRGIEGDLGPEPADSFARDLHPDLRADYVLANPPFNMKAWSAVPLSGDPRFRFGDPPPQNANFAWLQHVVHHLAPRGLGAVVLANGSLTVGGREGEIRRQLLDADLVDGVVALPGQLFYSTAIPVCVWLLAGDKSGPRDRRGQLLLLDARDLGEMIGRTHRALRPQDLAELAAIVHAWRGDPVPAGMSEAPYQDIPGRCRAVARELLAAHDDNLSPARHVAPVRSADRPLAFADEFAALRDDLLAELDRGAAIDRELAAALARIRVP